MNSRILKFAACIALTLGMGSFVACGSDSGSNAEEVKSSDSTAQDTADDKSVDVDDGMTVKTEDDLPKCIAQREGFTVFVKENNGVYVCEDFEWVKKETSDDVSDSDWESSSSVASSSSDDDGECGPDLENCDEDAIASSSSSDVIPDPDRGSSDSTPLADVKASGYYKTHCPSGHTCAYVSTKYLNPDITYGEILDTRDYQVYKTIEICNDANKNCQTWMAQNLNYDYNVKTAKSWCGGGVPDTKTEGDCSVYGRLYMWSAAMDSAAVFSDAGEGCGYGKTCSASGMLRGVCPSGWHLPSFDEWISLFTAVGGTSNAGTNLKSTSGWNSRGNGTGSFGFAVLPAGYRNYDEGNFSGVGYGANFWSSTEFDSDYAYFWYFYYNFAYVRNNPDFKDYGGSVRCLRD